MKILCSLFLSLAIIFDFIGAAVKSTAGASGSTAGHIGQPIFTIGSGSKVILGIEGSGFNVFDGRLKESKTPMWMLDMNAEEDFDSNVYVMVPRNQIIFRPKVTDHYTTFVNLRQKLYDVAKTCVYVSGGFLNFKANLELIEKPGNMDFKKALIFVRRSDKKLMAGELQLALSDFPIWL